METGFLAFVKEAHEKSVHPVFTSDSGHDRPLYAFYANAVIERGT